jgi:hypothetical protein
MGSCRAVIEVQSLAAFRTAVFPVWVSLRMTTSGGGRHREADQPIVVSHGCDPIRVAGYLLATVTSPAFADGGASTP